MPVSVAVTYQQQQQYFPPGAAAEQQQLGMTGTEAAIADLSLLFSV